MKDNRRVFFKIGPVLGHHNSNARKALDDFVAFDEAVGVGIEKTSSEDTLIIVTADHSHEFYFGGKLFRAKPESNSACFTQALSDILTIRIRQERKSDIG